MSGTDTNDELMTHGPEYVREKLREANLEPADLEGVDLPPSSPPPEEPPHARSAREPLNDYGNGRRFVIHYGDDAMHVPRVGWFAWNERFWEKDPDGINVRAKAQKIGETIIAEIPHIAVPDPDARRVLEKQHRTFARTSGNSTRISALLTEAQIPLSRRYDELDAGPLDVNTRSGVLRFSVDGGPGTDFSRTARLDVVPHAREQLLTKMMPVEYDPDAKAPTFDAFIERVQPVPENRAFLQRWFGLSMTAYTGEQKLAFLHGAGRNGKTVLMDTVARIFGDYAATAKIESLTGQNRRSGADATPDLVPLMGARMVRASEPEQGQRLQEGKIKELTGGEPILVRDLNEGFVEVRPVFKLTISGNHKPEIRGTDDGIWRRVLLVPFDVQIPKDEVDQELGAKLWEERAGIFNWLVDGLLAYLEDGLQEPEAVLAATADYRAESDPMGAFLADRCHVTGMAEDWLSTADLVAGFNFHCALEGMSGWKERTIAYALRAKAEQWRHPRDGLTFRAHKRSVSGYSGIRFTDFFNRTLRDAPKDQHGRPVPPKSPTGGAKEEF